MGFVVGSIDVVTGSTRFVVGSVDFVIGSIVFVVGCSNFVVGSRVGSIRFVVGSMIRNVAIGLRCSGGNASRSGREQNHWV